MSCSTCHVCNGDRTVAQKSVRSIKVEAGTPPGHKYKFDGEGNQGVDKTPGSLIFTVVVSPHHRYRREENDLLYEATVPLLEALVGFKKSLVHLSGRRLSIVHDIVTFSGYQKIIKGGGMPIHGGGSGEGDASGGGSAAVGGGSGGGSGEGGPAKPNASSAAPHGDLVINFKVLFPRRLTRAQRNVLREVMDDSDLNILMDVIRLARAGEDEHNWDTEKQYTRWCHTDEDTCMHDHRATVWRDWGMAGGNARGGQPR